MITDPELLDAAGRYTISTSGAPEPEHEHAWVGRPDQSTYDTQRYRCESCGSWGWRKFRQGDKPYVQAYADGRTYDELTVRECADIRWSGDDDECSAEEPCE